jgi:hypothetical protein
MDARQRRTPSHLAVATMLVLAAPVALFLLCWLRAPWSWLSTGALAWSTWASLRTLGSQIESPPSDRILRLVAAAVLALVVMISGVGGFGAQTWDWDKHNAILADLVAQPWPVAYRLEPSGERLGLVYYVAYYLPAAAAGKALGWRSANIVLLLWTVLGVLLAWGWLARLGRTSSVAALVVFVLFTGFDVLGATVLPTDRFAGAPWWTEFNLEWWHERFVYPDNVTLIAYAPHQALGGWLATALSLECLRRGLRGFPLLAPVALCLLWSPMAAVGLAALIAAYVVAGDWRVRRLVTSRLARRQRSFVSLAIVAGVAIPLILYYAARLSSFSLTPDLEGPAAARERASLAFMPATLGVGRFALEWASFFGIEVLPLVAVLALAMWLGRKATHRPDRFGGRVLMAASAILAVVPLVSFGYYNDWAMRVSIPALFALQVVVARTLSGPATRARAALAAFLLVAGIYPLAQLQLQVDAIRDRHDWLHIVPSHQVLDLFELQRTTAAHYAFAEQYVGGVQDPFFRYLAAPLVPRSIGGPNGGASQGEPAEPSAGVIRSN